jgi:hypothetical protein
MSTSDSTSGAEKRILPRLSLSHEVFRSATSGKLFGVADLSRNGMAVRVLEREDFYEFAVGAEISGILNLRRQKIAISGRVRHIGRDQVGIEFENLGADASRALDEGLDPHTLGRDLREVPTGDSTLFFASASGTEVLANRESDGRITRILVLVLGTLVQWEERGGLRTGRIRPADGQSYEVGITRMESMSFLEDRAIDPQKLGLARTLISSSPLPEEVKTFCFRRLEGASA